MQFGLTHSLFPSKAKGRQSQVGSKRERKTEVRSRNSGRWDRGEGAPSRARLDVAAQSSRAGLAPQREKGAWLQPV